MIEGAAKQTDSGLDATVADPSDDLLDMDRHALALARYIRRNTDKLPFTVAVLGKWGQGKSTLVRLLRYHLEHPEGVPDPPPLNFVSFSSWPYNTTEKLWRALILEIARELYKPAEQEEQSKEEQERPQDSGLVAMVQDFLARDAFHLHKPPPKPDGFREILEKLEEADFGQVRQSGPPADGGATLATMAGVAVSALSMVSPLVASLRGLLGLEPQLQLSDLVRREQGESARARVDPLTTFQELFRKMLAKRGNEEPVYIFVDDLDRAQPDVALDIIESIRIALWDARCVFIVAVDLRLIERGLRMRYKDLFADDRTNEPGRDYLEKIIQFSTPLPPATSEQVRRLIAGQFPEWAAAADIIEMVAGNIPRRVRQYCQYLSFQMLVARRAVTPGALSNGAAVDEDTEKLLDKLVQIHRRAEREQDAKVLRTLARLARHEAAFRSAAHKLEVAAADRLKPGAGPADGDAPEDVPPPTALAAEWDRLREAVGRSKSLSKLFAEEPRLSRANPRRVAALAQFADFTPDERAMLATRDGVFAGVLEAVLRRNLTDAGELVVEHLERVIGLYKDERPEARDLFKRLAALAATHHWQEVVASIEDVADYTDGPASEAGQALKELQTVAGVRTLLLTPTPLSRVPAELLALAWERRSDFEEARAVTQGAGDKLWAMAVQPLLLKERAAQKVLGHVEGALAIRIRAARHLIGMRKLAKLDALTRKWEQADEIAERTGYRALVEVEEYFIRAAAGGGEDISDLSEDARQLHAMCEADKALARFLRLPPLFGQMSPTELSLFRRIVTRPPEPKKPKPEPPKQQEPPQPTAPQPEPAKENEPKPEPKPETKPEVAPEPAPALESPPEEETPSPQPGAAEQAGAPGVDTLVFYITRKDTPEGKANPPINVIAWFYPQFDLSGGQGLAAGHDSTFESPLETIFPALPEALGIPADRDPHPYLTRMFSRGDTDYQFRLTDAGRLLFERFLASSMEGLTKERPDAASAVGFDHPARVVIRTNVPEVAELPWEWLSLPGQTDIFIMSPRHSLVRDFPTTAMRKRKQSTSRTRVLGLIPGVSGSESEIARKQGALAEVLDKMGAETTFLSGRSATAETLEAALFEFIPHILHFEGGLAFQHAPDGPVPCLLLYQSDGQMHWLTLAELKKMLKSSGVQLMVFGNGASNILQPNPITEMLRGLMDGLLPAAVAPVRNVEDAAAVEFTRGFYSALLTGIDLEDAFVRARVGLVGKGGDWTAFALFGAPITVLEMSFRPAF